MTQRLKNVEPPLARPRVQWTLAVLVLISLVCILVGSPRRISVDSLGADPRTGIEIDLNRAESRELALVPGIGPVLAGRIVDNRGQFGDFQSLQDLTRVHGIGPRTLEQITQLCFVESSTQGGSEGQRVATVGD